MKGQILFILLIIFSPLSYSQSRRFLGEIDKMFHQYGLPWQDVMNAVTTSATSPLSATEQRRRVLFLHVGKTAGSTIRCQLQKRHMELNCNHYFAKKEHRHEKPNQTAISLRVNEVTHLWGHQHAEHNYTDFLVALRNPIDRIESWWYYEKSMVQNGTKPNMWYQKLKGCYDNFEVVAEQGLRPQVARRRVYNSDKSWAKFMTCEEVAMACVAGDVPCIFHNYYNYEVYLENVLHWKEENTRPVRLDVIRGNHLWEDFDRINTLWGGSPGLVIPANMRERNVNNHTSTLSDTGRRNLCLALCREIVVYKTTLKHASNLNEEEKIESSKEVDESCGGLDVDQVCGATFEYCNIKGKKGIK